MPIIKSAIKRMHQNVNDARNVVQNDIKAATKHSRKATRHRLLKSV